MSDQTPSKKIITRRTFLLVVSSTAAGLVAGCRPDGDAPPPTVYSGDSAPTQMMDSGEIVTVDPRFGEVTFDQLILTDNDRFYTQTYPGARVPDYEDVNAEWSLRVDGLVDHPRTYSYEDIRNMPVYEDIRTLQCIGNPVGGRLVGNAEWTGVLIQHLLDEVQPLDTATRARFYAADGYSTAVDMEWIMQEGTFLAYKMNGQLLPRNHGYPLRIFMPGLYGQKMPKWIERIEFIDYDFQGFWEERGWSDVADVQTNSIVQMPPSQTSVSGQIAIQGIAFSGKERITRVDVKIDPVEGGDDGEMTGEWLEADVLEPDSPLVWTQWYLAWRPPSAGTFAVQVRATDEMGFTQNQRATGQFGRAKPDGTSAIHEIVVEVV